MKLALSTLCEHPRRRTGLATLFRHWVSASLEQADLQWIVFAGTGSEVEPVEGRVHVDLGFPANDRMALRLWADHFRVGPRAVELGAEALVTVGFVPVRCPLPSVMLLLSLHHRDGEGLGARYRNWAVRNGLRRAAGVIVNSRWVADELARDGTLPAGPLLVSPEGLDETRFNVARDSADTDLLSAHGLAPGYVLWASNFYRYKRAPLTLAAYAALPQSMRRATPLVLIGNDWNGGRAQAETAAKAFGILPDVRFIGWIPDAALPAFYRHAAAHVLSTQEETFGRSVSEAMACGCPCLVQDLSVLREVAGDAAWYVDFVQTSSAGAALQAILTQASIREDMRARGLERSKRFRFATLARERNAFVRDLVTRGT